MSKRGTYSSKHIDLCKNVYKEKLEFVNQYKNEL